MKDRIGPALLLTALATLAAHPAGAQARPDTTTSDPVEELERIVGSSGVEAAMDSIARRTGPELEEALGRLAATVGEVAARVAADPELRASALRAAGGMVELAQVVVAEQSEAVLEALRAAAERIPASPPSEGDDAGVEEGPRP